MGEICESRAKIAFLEISHFILSVYEASTVWQKCLFLNVTFQICQSSRVEYGWMMWSKDHKIQQWAERILLISVGKKFALEHAVAVLHSFTMFYGTVPAPPSALSNKALKEVDHVDQSRPGQEDESHALFPHCWLHHFYTSHLYVFCHLPDVGGQAPLSTEC